MNEKQSRVNTENINKATNVSAINPRRGKLVTFPLRGLGGIKKWKMETLKFKTNIKCGGCVANVTPVLNHFVEIKKWEVDIKNPDKILEIAGENLHAKHVINALKKAGYTAEVI